MNITSFNTTLIALFKYILLNILVEKYKKNHFKYQ